MKKIIISLCLVLGFAMLILAQEKPAEEANSQDVQDISIRTLEGHTNTVYSVAFSPDGTLLASGSGDKTIKVWRMVDWEVIKTLKGYAGLVRSVAFSPDGTLLASGSSDETIKIWRVDDGELIKTLKKYNNSVWSVAFSPDGTILASASLDHTIKVWRVADWKLIRTLKEHTDGVNSVAFSPDGTLLVSSSNDKTIKVWRVADWELIQTLELEVHVGYVGFSPDGKLLASAIFDKTIKVWRMADWELVWILEGHKGGVWSVAFSPDGTLLASGSGDKTIKVWDLNSLRMLWPTIEKLRAIKKDEFLSTQERTQQIAELLTKPTVLQGLPFELGSYNADTKAFSMTINVLGKHTAQIPMPTEEARDFKQDIGQFTLQVEVKVTPDEEIVCVGGELENPTSGKKYSLSQQSFATVAQTQGNGPVIEIIEPAGTTRGISIVAKGHQTKVVGIAKDASGVAYVQVNGQKASLNPVSGGVRFSAEVILGMGDNYINVEAMNTNQDKSFKNFVIKRGDAASAEVTKPGPSTKPSLWCLAIGVSNYKNPKLNLKYADYDATQLAAAFKSQSGKLFGEVHTKTLINAEATRNNILKAMGDFLGQACADDVALVFVAGHGIKHKQTGSYYFVTHETDPANLISSGLRWSDFEEGMTIIKSNVSKVILMLDTCHAGAMQVSMRDLEAGEDLAEMLKEAEGTYVLSSSKGSEASEEGEHLRLPGEPAGKGHGAFTYAILKGLAGEADLTRDNNITIFELNAYVGKLVPQITKGKQHPYPKTAGTDMPIYLTK